MAINSLSSASKGFSGLASGMDTQSLVDQMLKGTQTKIDNKNQQKSVLGYKQQMYRSVATQIKAFQQQFFSFTKADTNLMSNQLFQTMNAVSQSKVLTAKAGTNASIGKITIDKIESLAKNHREVSANKATGELSGSFSKEALDRIKASLTDADKSKITVNIGEGADAKSVDIMLSDIAGKSIADSVKVFNKAFEDAGVSTRADFLEGRVIVENKDGKALSISSGENAATVIQGAVTDGAQTSFSLDTKSILPKISLNVDGITKSIAFNPLDINAGEDEKTAILRQLNSNVKTAFGEGISFENGAGNKISLKVSNISSKVTVSGEGDSLSVIGIKNNLSNKISTSKSIKDVNFSTPLMGNMQKFSINGVDFSFTNGTSISNVMSEINSSDAGVRVSYDSVRDRFMIESTSSGKLVNTANGTPFEFKQTEGNMLSVMFGANASDTVSSNILTVENMRTKSSFDASNFEIKQGGFSIKVKENGEDRVIDISLQLEGKDPTEIVKLLNEEIAKVDSLKNEDGSTKLEFKLTGDPSGKMELELISKDPSKMTATVSGEALQSFGFTNKVLGSTLMSEMGFEDFTMNLNGTDVQIRANQTLDDFMQAIKSADPGAQVSLDSIGSTPFIRLAGVAIPMTFPEPAASKLFGANVQTGNGEMPTSGAFSKDAQNGYAEGANAVAYVNGEKIERSSNSFTVDGVSIAITGVTDEAQTIDVSQNTDVVFDTVKKFVEEYNKLVNDINKLIDADPTYKKYPPLTTEQKNTMSDKEVELWEEKAKGGLLRGDSTLTTIQSSLRSTIYTKPDPTGFALYDLGITSDYFGTKDNLAIGDEAELKRKIAENPDAVRKLFTDSEKGLSTMVNKALDRAASGGSTPGLLVQKAGATGGTDISSDIFRQMKSIDDTIGRLEYKYEQEYSRYWKQFNAMEQQISQLNQQSSWLTQQMG